MTRGYGILLFVTTCALARGLPAQSPGELMTRGVSAYQALDYDLASTLLRRCLVRDSAGGHALRKGSRAHHRRSACLQGHSIRRAETLPGIALPELTETEPALHGRVLELRLALQQISWGRPSPLSSPEQHTVALGITGSAGGHDVSQRLAKIETAISAGLEALIDMPIGA